MEQNENKLGKLTEESIKRKERLRALRDKAANSEKVDLQKSEKLPLPIFRSYKPRNENTTGEIKDNHFSDIEEAVKEQLDLLKDTTTIEEIDITSLAPRKPDWDLKRDIAKKLQRLERRTQKAIAELILERLKVNQEKQNIFEAVSLGTAHAGEKNNDVDEEE